jgi:hypothetical protein
LISDWILSLQQASNSEPEKTSPPASPNSP